MTPRPFGHRVFFLRPFIPEGVTPGGVYIQHDSRLASPFGRVTQVTPDCRDVRPGDWVVFRPNRPIRLLTSVGAVYALDETDVLAVVEPGDSAPWFSPEKAA
jgi:hypothetical protein